MNSSRGTTPRLVSELSDSQICATGDVVELTQHGMHSFSPIHGNMERPVVVGKQLHVGGCRFPVKGVTYGTFSERDGHQFPEAAVVARDFLRMVEAGINSVRVYTVPPMWLLDLAAEHGLYVMIGIPWEQHIAILEDRALVASITEKFRDSIRRCERHRAILCYSIGNEIPASVVRWHGRKKIEKFLHSLYQTVKTEDPQALVTYVNFPTTEFLNLDFVDFYSFNVYLESEIDFRAYLYRLQTLSGNKPLVLAEVGLDSMRNGELEQSNSLCWQLAAIFEAGCAGSFVFAWTDEWYVGGRTIEDWKFGLTTTDRSAKPALSGVKLAYGSLPFNESLSWPSFSVVVCSYNGASTLGSTLDALTQLEYPDLEVIVVNDGSTDGTEAIARQYPVTLISTENCGLSSARNTGYRASTGEMVAYIDDDAYPEKEWLRYLALAYMQHDVAAVGGPNYPVPDDTLIADCVANAPGSPMEVMLTDRIAEHIPGCNMSFKRSTLDKVGGFDPQFRAAGDDVDICWRVQEAVGEIGFQPAAFNWHHRRDSVRGYLKQQHGYGKAEALLEKKWPEKYNRSGHLAWQGRLYGQGVTRRLFKTSDRIYQGVWGCSPFQRLYKNTASELTSFPLMPEWLLLIAVLIIASVVALVWSPLLWIIVPALAALGITVGQAIVSAYTGSYQVERGFNSGFIKRFLVTTGLHLAQPVARLRGRLSSGLVPWRQSGGTTLPSQRWGWSHSGGYWDGKYQDSVERLTEIRSTLNEITKCQNGNPYENWDLQVSGGLFGGARLSLMVEHHGEHSEYVRFRANQRWSTLSAVVAAIFGFLSIAAFVSSNSALLLCCVTAGVLTVVQSLSESGRAITLIELSVEINATRSAIESQSEDSPETQPEFVCDAA